MAKQVVIIGGGFSGTALAIHIARLATDDAITVTVIEPRAQLGQGVAYSTLDPAHRINVPAEKMQLSVEEQGDFDRWYRRQPEFSQDREARWHDGKVYPQRAAFGRYIAQKFAEAAQQTAIALHQLHDRVLGLHNGVITTEGGVRIKADAVVLAVSHPPPALPDAIARALLQHPALIANPWQEQALASVRPQDRVAIVGTGLSMADVVASLQRRGHQGDILAFSRHGLLPRPNLTGNYANWTLDFTQPQPMTARGWLARVRREVTLAAEAQLPWQVVLDATRANGQRLWQQFPLHEQQRFLRHLRAWWDVHRYRIAPQVSALLDDKARRGALRVLAGRLQSITPDNQRVNLSLQQRSGGQENWLADKVIVTTGPAHATLLESQPLLQALTAQGRLQPDPLGLGVLVNARAEALDNRGHANRNLLIVGPAARGRFGELMGLPQVAEHAEAVAKQLLENISASAVFN